MTTIVNLIALIAAFAVIWTGHKRLEWYSLSKSVLAAGDLIALVLAVVGLGWVLGPIAIVVINCVGFVGWGVASAVEVQSQMAAASALGVGQRRDYERAYRRALASNRGFRTLRGRKGATLVRLVAERGRTPAEVELSLRPWHCSFRSRKLTRHGSRSVSM